MAFFLSISLVIQTAGVPPIRPDCPESMELAAKFISIPHEIRQFTVQASQRVVPMMTAGVRNTIACLVAAHRLHAKRSKEIDDFIRASRQRLQKSQQKLDEIERMMKRDGIK